MKIIALKKNTALLVKQNPPIKQKCLGYDATAYPADINVGAVITDDETLCVQSHDEDGLQSLELLGLNLNNADVIDPIGFYFFWFKKPKNLKIQESIPEYSGVKFLTKGDYAIIPPSTRTDSAVTSLHSDIMAFLRQGIPKAPESLIKAIQPKSDERTQNAPIEFHEGDSVIDTKESIQQILAELRFNELEGKFVHLKKFDTNVLPNESVQSYLYKAGIFNENLQQETKRSLEKKSFEAYSMTDKVQFNEIFLDKSGRKCLNTYQQKFKKTPTNGTCKHIVQHIRNICNNNETDTHNLLMWIAKIVQNPFEKMPWCVIIRSANQGNGKSALGNIVRELFDTSLTASIQDSELKSQYESWISGKIFVKCEELLSAIPSQQQSTLGRIKTLISENRISVSQKYLSSRQEDVFARFYLTTNEKVPLYIEKNDRRFFCIDSDFPEQGKEYMRPLIEAASGKDTESLQAFYNFLMEYDTEDIPYKAPFTEYKKTIIESSTGAEIFIIEDYLLQKGCDVKDPSFKDHLPPGFSAKLPIFKDKYNNFTRISPETSEYIIKTLGYKPCKRVARINGQVIRLYALEDTPEGFNKAVNFLREEV